MEMKISTLVENHSTLGTREESVEKYTKGHPSEVFLSAELGKVFNVTTGAMSNTLRRMYGSSKIDRCQVGHQLYWGSRQAVLALRKSLGASP